MPWRRWRPARGRLRAAPISSSAPGRARRRCPTRWWPSTGCPSCTGSPSTPAGCGWRRWSATRRSWPTHGVRERYTAIADASAIVGSHATRHVGTIGGNVMNASPAMETGGPLICFGAEAVLASTSGERRVAVADLLTAPGRTSAGPDELLVAVELPALPAGLGQLLRATGVPAADGDRDRRRHRGGRLSRTAGSPMRGSPSPRLRRPSAASRRPRRRSSGVTAGRRRWRPRQLPRRRPPSRSRTSAARPTTGGRWPRSSPAGGHRRTGARPRRGRPGSREPGAARSRLRRRRMRYQATLNVNGVPYPVEVEGTAACSRCCAARSG